MEFTGCIILIDLILVFYGIWLLRKILSYPRYVMSTVTYFAHRCVFFEGRLNGLTFYVVGTN